MPKRILCGLVLAFALIGSAGASASTLTMDGTTLVYTAAAGQKTDITVTQNSTTNPDTVVVTRNPGGFVGDNDPVSSFPGSCTESGGATVYTCTGVTAFSADAGDQTDAIDASSLTAIPTTLAGGAGDDSINGGDATNTVSGGDGNDFLTGGAAADNIDGGAGQDNIFGAGGNDTLAGGDGDDTLAGGTGTDTLSGGNGNDQFNQFYATVTNPSGAAPEQDTGDVFNGGDGYDSVAFWAQNTDQKGTGTVTDDVTTPLNQSVTLDDVANDGASGEGANVKSDVESVAINTDTGAANDATSGGTNTVTGNAAANQVFGSVGNDTIDPGAGNDFVQAGYGDDTINTQDGYADYVTCGPGNDTANVDSLDTVASDCETVNRKDVGNANEDRPPTITLTGPPANSKIATRTTTPFTANVTDDHGISAVLFTANGRLVCTATVAPYTCNYQPSGADVGRTAIVAVAVDTAQQTATAEDTVTVPRFSLGGFSASVSPKSDRVGAARFTTRGKVTLPAAVQAADGCGRGVVTIKISAAGRTISTHRTVLKNDCTYKDTVTFRSRKRFGKAKELIVKTEFLGSTVFNHSAVIKKKVKV